MLQRRERHVIETLASRIARRIDDGMGASAAFISVQPHVILAARVHVERLVFDAFVEAAESDPGASSALAAVRSLAALSMTEATWAGSCSTA